jgi:5-methylcytosine-specific restriction endonuclease McrA
VDRQSPQQYLSRRARAKFRTLRLHASLGPSVHIRGVNDRHYVGHGTRGGSLEIPNIGSIKKQQDNYSCTYERVRRTAVL